MPKDPKPTFQEHLAHQLEQQGIELVEAVHTTFKVAYSPKEDELAANIARGIDEMLAVNGVEVRLTRPPEVWYNPASGYVIVEVWSQRVDASDFDPCPIARP